MELLRLSALLLFIPTAYGDVTSLANNLPINPFANSAIIALPDSCAFSGKTGRLYVFDSSNTRIQDLPINVPQCRLKRNLIVVDNAQNGNMDTVNVGYQITGLNASSAYSAQYVFDTTTFDRANFTTQNPIKTLPATFARSGGMVVITVLLSIAMFLLVVGLIVVLVLGGKGAK
ncbi:hypothetical protein GDO81_014427 [Engystomops pustulosus]|uniref:Uroplakin-2 n=1 Tax=Engystomops pustulosus TaxID=76066 RepID=A0AAV7BA62_ENGPU|nr:hypothetical protein GDO81_014427 [Engystomops pustulosus]